MTPRIGICVPTRQRPAEYARMRESVMDTIKTANVLIYSSVQGDPKGYTHEADHYAPDYMPTVYRWNLLAKMAFEQRCDFIMLGSDDMKFLDAGWDDALIEAHDGISLARPDCVFHLQDTRDVNGTPHPIISRELYEQQKFLISPAFLHWFGDTVLVSFAKAKQAFVHIRSHRLDHIKPSDIGMGDSTHNSIRRAGWYERDKQVYELGIY